MLSIVIATLLSSAPVEGVVIRVVDGDTLLLSMPHRVERVRLHITDAPETRQEWGPRSTAELRAMTLGRTVSFHQTGRETHRQRRAIGFVSVDGLCVNSELVRRGHAWVDPRFGKGTNMLELQWFAMNYKVGLWSRSNPMPPWEWRKSPR